MKKRINKTLNSYSSTSGAFNKMRNYLGAQVSMMYVNSLTSQPDGLEQVRKLVRALIVK